MRSEGTRAASAQRSARSTDVLVVGAGPVGTSVACRLAERGATVGVLDESPGVDARVDRGSVLLYGDTLARLAGLGVRVADLGPTRRLHRVAIYAGADRKAVLDLRDGGAPLVATLAGLERALARRLDEERVRVEYRQRVCALRSESRSVDLRVGRIVREPSGYAVMEMVDVVGNVHDVSASWVVGADGPDSAVRARLDADLEAAAEAALFASLELRGPGPAEDEMRIVLDGDLTATSWPLPHGGHRYTFRLPDSGGYREELREVQPEPKVRHLMELLSKRLTWFDADPEALTRAEVEHLQPSIARRIGRDRVWLAGDAAHRVDPLAGRGINEGLLEAERLADAIAGALAGTIPFAEIGPRYERGVRDTLAPVHAPAEWFEARAADEPFVADAFERIVPLLPAEGEALVRLSSDLGIERRRAA